MGVTIILNDLAGLHGAEQCARSWLTSQRSRKAGKSYLLCVGTNPDGRPMLTGVPKGALSAIRKAGIAFERASQPTANRESQAMGVPGVTIAVTDEQSMREAARCALDWLQKQPNEPSLTKYALFVSTAPDGRLRLTGIPGEILPALQRAGIAFETCEDSLS